MKNSNFILRVFYISSPSGLPGSQPPTVGKFKGPLGEEEEDDDDLNGHEDASYLAEYYDPDFTQYYTPDAHPTQVRDTYVCNDSSNVYVP